MDTNALRLRDARRRAGFASGTEAARYFGWTVSTYLAHENGTRGISNSAAKKYAEHFHVSWAWLLGGGDVGLIPAGEPGILIRGQLGYTDEPITYFPIERIHINFSHYKSHELFALKVPAKYDEYIVGAFYPEGGGRFNYVDGDEILVSHKEGSGYFNSLYVISVNGQQGYLLTPKLAPRAAKARTLADMYAGEENIVLGPVVGTYEDRRRVFFTTEEISSEEQGRVWRASSD